MRTTEDFTWTTSRGLVRLTAKESAGGTTDGADWEGVLTRDDLVAMLAALAGIPAAELAVTVEQMEDTWAMATGDPYPGDPRRRGDVK